MRNQSENLGDDRLNNQRTTTTKSRSLKKQKFDLRRRLDVRIVLGSLLIIASFVSAYIISQSTSRMVTVWSASIDLAPGEIIEESDISPSRVALSDKAEFYLDGNTSILGSHVLRSIKASELIPAFALSETDPIELKQVPISVNALRMAEGIRPGILVDVYGIPRNSYQGVSPESENLRSKLLLRDVAVDAVNREVNKLGGDIGLTILVPPEEVGRFVNSIAEFDFLLVRSK